MAGLGKVLDGLALLAVLLASFLFLTPPDWLGRLGMVSGAVFGGAMALTVVMHAWGVMLATIVGVGGMWASEISFSRLMRGEIEDPPGHGR